MANPLLTKNYLSDGPMLRATIVKTGVDKFHAALATTKAEPILGVIDAPGGIAAAEERVDVIMLGIADVLCGQPVALGEWVTTDGNGSAIPGGKDDYTFGFMLEAGDTGEIAQVMILGCGSKQ